jgi:hypothetical protein
MSVEEFVVPAYAREEAEGYSFSGFGHGFFFVPMTALCKKLFVFLEQLRRKDEAIRQALSEKQLLVADILHVPKDEFENIAELAGEPSVDKEATELVLAAVSQGMSNC